MVLTSLTRLGAADAAQQPPAEPIQGSIRLGLPKGKIQEGVFALLAEAGIKIKLDSRGYRPYISLPHIDAKVLKPQNILEMLHMGSRDIGFAGVDWVHELRVNVVELLDTGLDPVKIVAAAPRSLVGPKGELPAGKLVVASEYETLTKNWIKTKGIDARFVRSYGATEVFPPEDADIIVDNSATGSTLYANQLTVVDEILTSSTRLFASPQALDKPATRQAIEDFVLLLKAVLEARSRVLLELNVSRGDLNAVISILPCMRQPTVSPLRDEGGFAVRVAVKRKELPQLIPLIKAKGGTDIIVTTPSQIVP